MLLSRLALFFLLFAAQAWAGSALQTVDALHSSSLLALDQNGQPLYAKDPDKLLIPASTVKVLTALIALEHWGGEHQFATEFYIDRKTNYLWVRGLGDPYLVSEELDLIVQRLQALGIKQLQGIAVDSSFFSEDIHFDGQGGSNNPYDASVSALAANFNTIKVRVAGNKITSGEAQTPITPLAKKIATALPDGTHRINLGQSHRSTQYFAQLLHAKLMSAGILIGHKYRHGLVASEAELLFVHKNSRTLQQMVAAMLQYSNNFIANHLYLLLGVENFGAPAHPRHSQQVFADYIEQHFQWLDYALVDGAGLSRQNRMSARQLTDVLQKFAKYRQLMPKQNQQIRAKTGTLKNVSTYAGYLQRNQQWSAFAVIINQPVNYFLRERLAEELLQY